MVFKWGLTVIASKHVYQVSIFKVFRGGLSGISFKNQYFANHGVTHATRRVVQTILKPQNLQN